MRFPTFALRDLQIKFGFHEWKDSVLSLAVVFASKSRPLRNELRCKVATPPEKGLETTKALCKGPESKPNEVDMLENYTSWEIMAHNTVLWTGNVVVDYKVLLILLVVSVIRTLR